MAVPRTMSRGSIRAIGATRMMVAAAFAVIPGRLAELGSCLQGAEAGQPWRPSHIEARIGDQSLAANVDLRRAALGHKPAQEGSMNVAWRMPDSPQDPALTSLQEAFCRKEGHLSVVRDRTRDTIMRWQVFWPVGKLRSELSQRPELNLRPEAVTDCAANKTCAEQVRTNAAQSACHLGERDASVCMVAPGPARHHARLPGRVNRNCYVVR
jgi:hypothetical protein